jgi:hypothetical protein
MARASCYLSATSWQEQVTIFQQHHGENKLLFVSNIIAGTSYYLSATSWQLVAVRNDNSTVRYDFAVFL